MISKILFVDDEPNILEGFQRQLHKTHHTDVALGGAAGLVALRERGPYAVVVSDMRMPEMSGAEFLKQAQLFAKNSVRIMLTGNADQQTAVDAVNQGQIFRFMTKPCSTDVLVMALNAGIEQYRLITAEAELLEKTLLGSIGVLTDILGVTDPGAFEHGKRMRRCVQEMAPVLNFQNQWQLELAAILAPIGRTTLPPALKAKCLSGAALSEAENDSLARVPEVSYSLIVKIPRLEPVAQIVRYHTTTYQHAPGPTDNRITGDAIPLGARILKIISDLVEIEKDDTPRSLALRLMSGRKGSYDPTLLKTVTANIAQFPSATAEKEMGVVGTLQKPRRAPVEDEMVDEGGRVACVSVGLSGLKDGDVLVSDVRARDGRLLLARGNAITEAVLEKLKGFVNLHGVREPLRIAITEEAE